LRNLNFLLKIFLASFLIGFSLYYQNLIYNLVLIIISLLLALFNRIAIIRNPKQLHLLFILLIFIFLFQIFNDYGKILVRLPFNLTITENGLNSASIFVTQISLIFLLFGIAINSTPQQDILYYFHKIGKFNSGFGETIQPLLRIGLFVFYLLPKSINIQQETRTKLSKKKINEKYKQKKKISMVMGRIYFFISSILILSENDYPGFIKDNPKNTPELVNGLFKVKSGILIVSVVFCHGIILWS